MQKNCISYWPKAQAATLDYLLLWHLSAAASEGFGKNAQHYTSKESLVSALRLFLPTTRWFNKGSRSMKMEEILKGLVPEPHHH